MATSTGIIALLSAALVLIATFNGDYVMRRGAIKSALMWVGARSFALYLVHLPAFALTRWLIEAFRRLSRPYTDHNTLAFVLVATVLLVALAEASFRIIEHPLRRHGRILAERVALCSVERASTVRSADDLPMHAALRGRMR